MDTWQLEKLHGLNQPSNNLSRNKSYCGRLRSKCRESKKRNFRKNRKANPDKYKTNNDGSYRAFELHRYRIAYRVKEKEVLIFRVRHTSREPKQY